jgi:outer membrane protein insertion porin family
VLAVSLRGGVAQGLDKTRELPLVERFFLGGRTTVRGYEQDTLGPKGVNGTPTGGNAFVMGNLELRTDVGKGFGIVTFLDGGNVFKKANNLDITNLKYTAGVGLRYNTPVGPFRIDYGHKLNRERGESRGEIHFSLGHAF